MWHRAGDVPSRTQRIFHDDELIRADARCPEDARDAGKPVAGRPGRLLLAAGAAVVLRARREAGVLRADAVAVVVRLPLTAVRPALGG